MSFAVICSGGLDSSTVVAMIKTYYETNDIHLIHFSYGQDSSNTELSAVRNLKILHNLEHEVKVIDAKQLFSICDANSLLLKDNVKNIDILKDMERDIHYVSMRNSIFSIISASLCEKYDIDTLACGVNLTEGLVYTDNGNRWFYTMKELLLTSGKKPIRFIAPLLNLLKYEIIKVGLYSGALYDITMSCYHPVNGISCGACGSCMNRIRAFAKNNMSDALTYNIETKFDELPQYTPLKSRNKLKQLINDWRVDI